MPTTASNRRGLGKPKTRRERIARTERIKRHIAEFPNRSLFSEASP